MDISVMFCELLTQDNIHYECILCGMKIVTQDDIDDFPMMICRQSLNKQNDPVNFIQNVKSFAEGGILDKKCSDEEILSRHDICSGCEFFKNNTCDKCGCIISRNKEFANKLIWSDQKCPIDKW